MTYPQDAITKTYYLSNVVPLQVIDTPPITILGVHIAQSGTQSNTIITCGTAKLAVNFDKDYSLDLINYVCNENLNIEKTGAGDSSFSTITYIKRDISQATSTDTFVYNGFTNGEIINGVFLFLILMVLSFGLFLKMLYPKK